MQGGELLFEKSRRHSLFVSFVRQAESIAERARYTREEVGLIAFDVFLQTPLDYLFEGARHTKISATPLVVAGRHVALVATLDRRPLLIST
jgi:hypothetical protein